MSVLKNKFFKLNILLKQTKKAINRLHFDSSLKMSSKGLKSCGNSTINANTYAN